MGVGSYSPIMEPASRQFTELESHIKGWQAKWASNSPPNIIHCAFIRLELHSWYI